MKTLYYAPCPSSLFCYRTPPLGADSVSVGCSGSRSPSRRGCSTSRRLQVDDALVLLVDHVLRVHVQRVDLLVALRPLRLPRRPPPQRVRLAAPAARDLEAVEWRPMLARRLVRLHLPAQQGLASAVLTPRPRHGTRHGEAGERQGRHHSAHGGQHRPHRVTARLTGLTRPERCVRRRRLVHIRRWRGPCAGGP